MVEIYKRRTINHKEIVHNRETQKQHQIVVQQEETQIEQIPFEAMPVMRAVKKYATQTYALGLSAAIAELKNVENMLQELYTIDKNVENILIHVKKRHQSLVDTFTKKYGE